MKYFRFSMQCLLLAVILVCLKGDSCGGLTSPVEPAAQVWRSPEQYCASQPSVNGNAFYCGTTVGFMQQGLPNGWYGGCFIARFPYNGLTGFNGYSGSGGYTTNVRQTLSEAQQACRDLQPVGGCTGILQCYRQ
jgi:hypothetical protein